MSSTFTVDTDLLDFDLLSHVLDEIDETDIPAPSTPEKGVKKKKGKKKLNSLEKADRCLAYSVLILKHLRINNRGCIPIEKVCGACGVPQDMGRKIVRELVTHGLIYARRGKVSGGIQIGRQSPIMLDELRKIFDMTVFRFDYI